MHPVVEFLHTHAISELEALGINVRWSDVDSERCICTYDQIKGDRNHPLVAECRGLVLQQSSGEPGGPGSYRVVAQPFRRFYNLGDPQAAPIDWSTAAFENKLDGTLCIVYWYGEGFKVATRNVPDANVPCANGKTFARQFWDTMYQGNHDAELLFLESYMWSNITTLWEYTAPDNQIVLPYQMPELTLLAAFDCGTGKEIDLGHTVGTLRRPQRWTFDSIEAARAWVNMQDGTTTEGLVVVDGNGNRLKIKNANYLLVADILTSANSNRAMMDLILRGATDDVLGYLPQAKMEKMLGMEMDTLNFIGDVDVFCKGMKLVMQRKTVALSVQSSRFHNWMAPIMDIWSGKAEDMRDWIRQKVERNQVHDTMLDRFLDTIGASP